jgi:hypothetical protein
MTDAPTASTGWPPVRYCVETDTMAVQIGPWPGQEDDDGMARDADVDLIIHYAPDRQALASEIEHFSLHPEHVAAALAELRRQSAVAG